MTTTRLVLLLPLLATACASSGPARPDADERIRVTVADAGALRGVHASYRVAAGLKRTSGAILEIEARPENSELVAEARTLDRGATAGRSLIWFATALGIPGRGVYQYRIDDSSERRFRYDFMVLPEGGQWRVAGSYSVTAEGDGCRVEYEFTSSLGTMSREALMRLIRRDASRILARAEGR